MSISFVPDEAMLPQVLPNDRLLANGIAIPELRAKYRDINTWRNIRAVFMVWFWTLGLAELGTHFGWLVAIAVFILMGPMHARFAILMHEAAHRLLFRKKKVNDFVDFSISSKSLCPPP
jgi:fatty acid desaturase